MESEEALSRIAATKSGQSMVGGLAGASAVMAKGTRGSMGKV